MIFGENNYFERSYIRHILSVNYLCHKMSQKRNRSINWDEEEKQLLRSVLKEYAQVIENKCLDTNTNKIKTKAWEQVHKKFNELNTRPRELSQLKIQWKTMKLNARKLYSSFKKEVTKTGGGARPPTPNDAVIEVKDLLNPAELLIDHNIYDSDGHIIGDFELPNPGPKCPIKLQNSTLMTSSNDNDNKENEQMFNIIAETIEDVDVQMAGPELTPLVIFQENVNTPVDRIMETPIKKSMGIKSAKKGAKRNIVDGSMKTKEQEDYVNSMVNHSRMIKDKEHMRKMEMAEEEHAVKMEILNIEREYHREKLKSAVLEREILELKKARESVISTN